MLRVCHCIIDLFNEGFYREVGVIIADHGGVVLLKVGWEDMRVGCVQMSEDLEDSDVFVANVRLL